MIITAHPAPAHSTYLGTPIVLETNPLDNPLAHLISRDPESPSASQSNWLWAGARRLRWRSLFV